MKQTYHEFGIDLIPLPSVRQRVSFTLDDRSIRPFVVVKTKDAKTSSNVIQMWIVMVDVQNQVIEDH